MDIGYLIFIITVLGAILLSINIIIDLLSKKKANINKRVEINNKIQQAFEEHSRNIKEMQKKYNELYSEFASYKNETETIINEMQKYNDKIIEIGDSIITLDEQFESKLYLWCELLKNPDNSETVREEIKKHMEYDIKLKNNIKFEQEQRREQIEQMIKLAFGLDR